jgi:hypothetical protein
MDRKTRVSTRKGRGCPVLFEPVGKAEEKAYPD